MKNTYIAIVTVLATFLIGDVIAQQDVQLPPCRERPTLSDAFQVEPLTFCLEHLMLTPANTVGNFTSLVFDDHQHLYATNPLDGEVIVFSDEQDGDFGLIDTETVLLRGLTFPHGLAYADDTLYILGDGTLYTYDVETDTLLTLVDDLPINRVFPARAIFVDEQFIYLGIPAACDLCIFEDEESLRGTVLRMERDGSNRMVMARGFRYPTGMTVYDNQLLVTDVAADYHLSDRFVDEINTINLADDTVPHFGFPHCYGDNLPEEQLDTPFDCQSATPPSYLFSSHSTPFAITPYRGDAFHWLQSSFLVALLDSGGGTITGNALIGITPHDENTVNLDAIVPSNFQITRALQLGAVDSMRLRSWYTEQVNRTTLGLFPQAIYSVAVGENGWIYFTTSFDGLFVLRPRTDPNLREIRCNVNLYCDD